MSSGLHANVNTASIKKLLHQVGKISYRPVLCAKLARGFFRTLVLRKPTLRVVEFSITAECQSKCTYCYAAKFRKEDDTLLSLAEIKYTWEQAKRMGAVSAMVFGGEPLMHPQFLEILEVLQPRQHLIGITTNAILLTEPIVIEMKRLGVSLVDVSLNALDPALNDRLRGYDGHFEKAMSAISLCKKHGIEVGIPIATYKKYLKETHALVDFATQNGVTATILLMCGMGRNEGKHEEMFDQAFWDELQKLYEANPTLRGDYNHNFNLKTGCPAGFEKIHVGPYGDVTGCSMNPVSFGNVRTTALEDIVSKMRHFRHFAKRASNCIIAVDDEYIKTYMDYAARYASTPYPVELNPQYVQDSGNATSQSKKRLCLSTISS
jgi:MoaA/NifB/PqqE/SkfB family radical SAM enzyme